MNLLIEDLDNFLKEFFQYNVTFYIGKKRWKTGKFMLHRYRGFFIEFVVKNKKLEKFDVPFPFKYYKSAKGMIFSYKISDLTYENPELIKNIEKYVGKIKNKYYNNILRIDITNETTKK